MKWLLVRLHFLFLEQTAGSWKAWKPWPKMTKSVKTESFNTHRCRVDSSKFRPTFDPSVSPQNHLIGPKEHLLWQMVQTEERWVDSHPNIFIRRIENTAYHTSTDSYHEICSSQRKHITAPKLLLLNQRRDNPRYLEHVLPSFPVPARWDQLRIMYHETQICACMCGGTGGPTHDFKAKLPTQNLSFEFTCFYISKMFYW